MDAIAGRFEIDWSKEDLERVTRTIVKKYNAEIHSQSAIEGTLELKHEHHFGSEDVERVEIEIFDVAHNIIGGGEEGDKTAVGTKEQADHSLQYMVAVSILDGQVMPEQYLSERIQRADVQNLLRKVTVRASPVYSLKFPTTMPCRIMVQLRDGQTLIKEKQDYEGFHTRPMTWPSVVDKFERLGGNFADTALRKEILDAVARLESIQIADLTELLTRVRIVRT
jgi:2-methylcitrate dehydratase